MSSLLYHSVEPELVKSFYSPLDLIDFELDANMRKFVPGTLRFEADLEVEANTDTPVATEDIKFSSRVGASCFIESITTSFANSGQIEHISNYSRLMSMVTNTTESVAMGVNSNNSMELKSVDDAFSRVMVRGVINRVAGVSLKTDLDFSIRPLIALNRVEAVNSADNSVSFAKTGVIRVSVQLARVFDSLFGSQCTASTNYKLKNPRMVFTSIPDDGKQALLQMKVAHSIKSSLNSAHAVLSTRVPVVANACSVTFQQVANESNPHTDNNQQEVLPQFNELVFLFNSASNQYVTYSITDRTEVLDKYLESMKGSGLASQCNLQTLKSNQGYGVGLAFPYIDLSKQAFNIQLDTGINSTNPYVAYMFFHGIIEF